MRIGVLGTFVWDRIWHPESGSDHPVEQLGGIAYSLAAMSVASSKGWTLVPLVKVGADLSTVVDHFMESLPNAPDCHGVRVVPNQNNRVELRYHDNAERTERLTGGVPGWSADEVISLAHDLDALYVNFLCGDELSLDAAKRVSEVLEIPLYTDLHSLFLGPPSSSGPRLPRRLPKWQEWVGCFDVVQVNEVELRLMGEDEGGFRLSDLLRFGPQMAIVTRGGAGAAIAHRFPLPGRAEWPRHRRSHGVPTNIVEVEATIEGGPSAGDPTGCGDVWGAVMFAGLLEGLDPTSAARRAHAAAAAKMRARSIDSLAATIADALA